MGRGPGERDRGTRVTAGFEAATGWQKQRLERQRSAREFGRVPTDAGAALMMAQEATTAPWQARAQRRRVAPSKADAR